MRATHWISDDGRFEGSVEADVAAYEERQANVLAWLGFPWDVDQDLPTRPHWEAGFNLINLAPKWLAMFRKSTALLDDGDLNRWKQEMLIELDALEQEFMAIVREPVADAFTEIARDLVGRLHRDSELADKQEAEL